MLLPRCDCRENDLSNLINNAAARDELFGHNSYVSIMKREIASMQRKDEDYEKCLQSVCVPSPVPFSMRVRWKRTIR